MVPSLAIVHPMFCGMVSVDAPLMVEVVGVIVTVPAPLFWTSKPKPVLKLPVACGRVTATGLALLNVTRPQPSLDKTV